MAARQLALRRELAFRVLPPQLRSSLTLLASLLHPDEGRAVPVRQQAERDQESCVSPSPPRNSLRTPSDPSSIYHTAERSRRPSTLPRSVCPITLQPCCLRCRLLLPCLYQRTERRRPEDRPRHRSLQEPPPFSPHQPWFGPVRHLQDDRQDLVRRRDGRD